MMMTPVTLPSGSSGYPLGESRLVSATGECQIEVEFHMGDLAFVSLFYVHVDLVCFPFLAVSPPYFLKVY